MAVVRLRLSTLLPAALLLLVPAGVAADDAPPLPSGQEHWVGAPASWPQLRGRVTLLFVWTFG